MTNTSLPDFRSPENIIMASALLIIGVNGVLFWGTELDDALIYARYLQNLIIGNGFVYNPGEYINGLTSPLFAYLAILPAIIFGDARDGIIFISVLANMATVLTLYRVLTLVISDKSIAAISALLAALASITYINLGMEASLFTFLISLCIYLYLTDRHFYLGISIGLAILARPEGVFLVPALALNTFLFKRRWPPINSYVIPTVLVMSQLLFNWLYYGTALPTSGLAKVSQGTSGYWGESNFLITLVVLFDNGFRFSGNWLATGILLVLALFAFAVSAARQYLVVTLTFLMLYTGFFALFNIPAQAWYYAIYFTLLWTYSALGIYWLAYRYLAANLNPAKIMLLALLTLVFLWQEPRHLQDFGRTTREDYKSFGLWLAENTAEDASIAVVEIGTIGWYADRRIIDILGLVTSQNADFVADGDFTSWISVHTPDYILVHEPLMPYEAVIDHLQQTSPDSITEVTAFQFPGYRLYRYSAG